MTQLNTAPADVPPGVTQLASQWGLGAYLQAYPPHRRVRFLVISGVLFAIFGLIALGTATTNPNPQQTGRATGVVIMGLLAALALAGFIVAFLFSPVTSKQARNQKIYIFEQGYIQVSRKAATAYRWDRVAALYQEIVTVRYNGISTGTQYRYKIEFADGRVHKLNTFTANMPLLGPVLQAEVAKVQVPQAFAMMRAGQWVNFGPFAVSGAGLVVGNNPPVPWAEVTSLQVFNGRVLLSRANTRGRLANAQASKIPNLRTFLVVVDQLMTTKGQL